eukprot:3061761-Pyramimonas_sp.AAC.1
MGPALHIGNPSGLNVEEISSVSLVCEWVARQSRAGGPSLWGPQLHVRIRASPRDLVVVVTAGLLRNEGWCESSWTNPNG